MTSEEAAAGSGGRNIVGFAPESPECERGAGGEKLARRPLPPLPHLSPPWSVFHLDAEGEGEGGGGRIGLGMPGIV